MQSSTTTTLPTRTRPFESQQHPLAKTHWSMLHRRVRKARGPWFNRYTWRWMMSSSRTSPGRSLPFSSRDTFLTHPSCPQNFVAPRVFPNDKTRARLRRERFAADWPIWPLQAACTLMVGRDLARVRCSCIRCIALGEPFGRSGICPAAPLHSPGSTGPDTRDRSIDRDLGRKDCG